MTTHHAAPAAPVLQEALQGTVGEAARGDGGAGGAAAAAAGELPSFAAAFEALLAAMPPGGAADAAAAVGHAAQAAGGGHTLVGISNVALVGRRCEACMQGWSIHT